MKTPTYEFNFMRQKLEKIARLLTQNDPSSIIEAAFMIGCLHTVCCENADRFASEEDIEANVE